MARKSDGATPKKAAASTAKGTAPPAKPAKPPTANIMSVRGTPEYKAWLDEFAAKSRTTAAGLLDLAVAEKAARDGFRPPPPRH